MGTLRGLILTALCGAAVAHAQFVPVREHAYGLAAATRRGVGAALARCDDLNGDGVAEIAVGAAGVAAGHFTGSGPVPRVEIRDGATGALLSAHYGPQPGESFGAALAWLGDVDGDGAGELAVGAPLATWPSGGGRVYRLSLGTGAIVAAASPPAQAHAPGYGRYLAALPDIDGDGVADFVAGFSRSAMNGAGGAPLGAVGVYSGASATLVRTHGVATTGQAGAGSAVAAVPDVDFDGVADYAYRGATSIFVHSGATGALRFTSGAAASFGDRTLSLLGVEDQNGDGRGDLLIGAAAVAGGGASTPPCGGGVVLASGQNGSALWTRAAPAGAGYFGASTARCEDVDADGVPDVLVAAPGGSACDMSASGAIHVVSTATGAPLSVVAVGDENDALGFAMAASGDVDGDGATDVVVGNPYLADVGLVRARTRAGGALWSSTGEGAVRWAGRAAAGMGDVDGDGVPDYAVGLPLASSPARPRCGLVEVRSGAHGGVLQTFEGPLSEGHAGFALAAADDVDADGVRELLIGAPGFGLTSSPFGPTGSGRGRVYTWSVASGVLLTTTTGGPAHERFGAVLATVADADGDGVRDWVVGAPGYVPGASGSGTVGVPGPAYSFSGATGAPLAQSPAPLKAVALADAGDWDGDGKGDVAIGAPWQTGTTVPGPAVVTVWSPGAGTVVGSFGDFGIASLFGAGLSGAGDVDGDGVQDLLAASPGTESARVVRGGFGTTLRTYVPNAPFGAFGFGGNVLGVADQDGDGVRDHVVGVFATDGADAPQATLYSGATGVPLVAENVSAWISFGGTLAELGDLDGDGREEFLAGESLAPVAGGPFSFAPERVRVLARYGVPAGSTLFGARCAAAGFPAPSLRAFGGPFAPGSSGFGLVAFDAPPNATVCLIAGGSATTWAGAPLPMPLDFVGLVGCALSVSADLFASTAADATGEARFAFGIPGAASLSGFTLYVQAAALGGPPPLGFSAVSDALALTP